MPVEKNEFATVKDNKDPEKMGRVKVQHIWQTGDEMTHWLDASQLYAGELPAGVLLRTPGRR
jgi:uncharacterized protein involved in type VI secretion and phage assembly